MDDCPNLLGRWEAETSIFRLNSGDLGSAAAPAGSGSTDARDAERLQRLRPAESEVDTTCSIFDSSGVAVQDVGIARLISGLVKSAGAESD